MQANILWLPSPLVLTVADWLGPMDFVYFSRSNKVINGLLHDSPVDAHRKGLIACLFGSLQQDIRRQPLSVPEELEVVHFCKRTQDERALERLIVLALAYGPVHIDSAGSFVFSCAVHCSGSVTAMILDHYHKGGTMRYLYLVRDAYFGTVKGSSLGDRGDDLRAITKRLKRTGPIGYVQSWTFMALALFCPEDRIKERIETVEIGGNYLHAAMAADRLWVVKAVVEKARRHGGSVTTCETDDLNPKSGCEILMYLVKEGVIDAKYAYKWLIRNLKFEHLDAFAEASGQDWRVEINYTVHSSNITVQDKVRIAMYGYARDCMDPARVPLCFVDPLYADGLEYVVSHGVATWEKLYDQCCKIYRVSGASYCLDRIVHTDPRLGRRKKIADGLEIVTGPNNNPPTDNPKLRFAISEWLVGLVREEFGVRTE